MYYPIVASDLDGTLLNPDHRLAPFTRETLQLLVKKGIHFVFATGRHYVDVGQMRDNLGISAYMITSNGARVHSTEGELVFSQNLDEDIADELFAMQYHHPHVFTNVYRDETWFLNRERPEEEDFFRESDFNYQIYRPGALPTDGISKVFFTCSDPGQLEPIEQALLARWGDRINTSFSLPTCLEVMAGGVSKGHALEAVARRLGHLLSECITFGDGMNDVEMLSMSGKGCIMQNGAPALKARLPQLEIIGSNADEAVSHYLRKLYQV
ncbi:sugar/pyridoxal phosphate phosphatase YigL [Erwinia sp. OLTSP20]|uniref:sugar/pyridoxal phosphate phosphatase YigL n=1 Tax=unclassified Erwinia TaxID=2622719 RepID=UPI000C1A3064|nr:MULTISPECIES: sugar/pyridoxal phosphate phosphatase YigL [unclassified Erwinia]PIJ50794.1 sugar/pyridoxal phosphate phosphatase YigL [Erwinia sp. OAMSP11]PIJ72946.1 sugar/pyridoxal phosphate phosphatase YigL [Erwinia sp. OLSSP12]PIJ81961.1 sugar/pyridoxal phosphate phosphatase YigL [Erwinia sp. OLCASP19]PIJ84616.1 sugar/pyridoxal phosphate phosphatase YigL [Erwinia sp. OLMTSP26]PIJ86963.1 sugar/pyridoxal phosphate phosphatase YigL [Erwinia sp. OLMDSP33]